MYINCHSYYSLRYGILSEAEIIQTAKQDGASQVVLTDINNTSACLNFIRLAQYEGLKPIIGIDFRNEAKQYYLGIAYNNNGFHQLNSFLSYYSHRKKSIPENAPPLDDVFFIYPLSQWRHLNKKQLSAHEFIGINRNELNQLPFSGILQMEEKLVALNAYTFRNKKDFNTHRLLRAIDNNCLLSKLPTEQQGNKDDIYLKQSKLAEYYSRYPRILNNTKGLLNQCSISFDFSAKRPHQNKTKYCKNQEEDEALLLDLCYKGLAYRYSVVTENIIARMTKELETIKQMEYVPFFLVNWDIVNYAKGKGYYHVGRGSGANSLVAYLLGITDVDPIALDLYFEQFMNLYRTSPPDFDIDFSWRDREDVTRYIFDRFGGEGQVALLATYNTFKHSAAVRELGKVFGLPNHEIEKLSKGRFEFDKLDHLQQLVLIYSKQIEGMPNYLSIHAGGIIIAERPIHYFTATNLPPKGFPTTQFDMVVSEDVGLYKYDILGQRGLGKIKDAIQLVKINQPNAQLLDIHNTKPFLEDPNINQLVSQAKCIGCFYVESPAMRMLLKKLEVNSYLGLVAASSIIRPGVAKSGMMREYILRHKNEARRNKAHPALMAIMPETYGVMVYQEDVIKVAHYFAGLTLSEADVLRRGMSGKYRSREEFQKVQHKFIDNCRKKGYQESTIKEIWRQIESFAGYAFAKGHSASYAVESYQSLYLKTYFPLEYMVAVINNGGGFYSTELYVHEARKCGAAIHAPCINKSRYATWLYGKDIYLGMHLIHGLEHDLATRIIQDRNENGNYLSLEGFIERVPIGIEQLCLLIRINAFRSAHHGDKRALLWKAYYILNKKPDRGYQLALFSIDPIRFELPKIPINPLEHAFDEIEILGFPLCFAFDLLKDPLKDPILLAEDLSKAKNKYIAIYGHLITVKNTITSNKKRMQFGTFLDFEGNWLDTVHFPPIVKRFPFRGRGVYKIKGKVVEEFGFYTIEVSYLERLPYMEDPRFSLTESVANISKK